MMILMVLILIEYEENSGDTPVIFLYLLAIVKARFTFVHRGIEGLHVSRRTISTRAEFDY